MLSEAGKHYGDGIIKEYSKKLTYELGKGYTQSRLRYFRRFYDVFSKCPTLSDKLTYSHYCELIWNNDFNKIYYYINISINQNLSVRQLRNKIKSNEYERLPDDTKNKLINAINLNVTDFVKNPIRIIKSINYGSISEKVLQKLILENIPAFLEELGEGFTFIKNEYPIKIGNRYNYIDLLLYNIKYKCYVVIELKITELKKEHTGQIQTYMNYIDKSIKPLKKTILLVLLSANKIMSML